ncbi:hypothetical protein IV203_030022 [Nitzschia inconspicua]|uniref:Uncharacterized protein n=1 Tax=Nitzschia inconspicua TaxID=303405 RepID=A0A9K3LVC9_9STRA|nr:hypothetical protein IV203_030022 [Nitzschia inconspicua]
MTAPDASTALLVGKNVAESAPVNKSRKILYLVLGLLVGAFIGGFVVHYAGLTRRPSVESVKRDSKYTATQFLSFSLNTLEEGALNMILEMVLNSLSEDVLDETPQIDHSPDVLKIFLLPEFTFRGPFGAYSLSDLKEGGLLLSVGGMISNLINDPKFENWLLFFGTIIMAQSSYCSDSSEKPWEAEGQYLEEGEIMYFSFAPIVKGGSEVLTSKFQLYKNYISTVDFLDRENGLPNPRKSNIAKYGDLFDTGDEDMKDSILNQRGVRIIEGNVFEIDGIRFGMEICLDHRMGVLWENLQQDNSSLVDVHLITSHYDEVYDPKSVCREGPVGLKHVPNFHSKSYNSYISPENCFVPRIAWKELVTGYYSNYREQGCAYTLKMYGLDVYDEMEFYPPSVEVYPTIALPWQKSS